VPTRPLFKNVSHHAACSICVMLAGGPTVGSPSGLPSMTSWDCSNGGILILFSSCCSVRWYCSCSIAAASAVVVVSTCCRLSLC